MGLSSDELALLTALLSASFSEDAEEKEKLRQAAGLAHTRFNTAIKALEGRGLLTRQRTAVRGNGKTWRLHRDPVPEDERTGTMPESKKPRSRNADRLKRDGSTDGRPSVEEASEKAQQNATSNDVRMDVHPQNDVRMDVHPPATDGRPSVLPIQTFTNTSSSLGSSSTAGLGAGEAEEEEGENSKKNELELAARRLAASIRPHLERSKKFLLPAARDQVIELLIVRLEEGHREEFLEAQLGRWCREAKNPSVFLPMQLDELGPPRPDLRVVPAAASETPKPQAPPASEETQARAMELARKVTSRPRVNGGRNPYSTEGDREPRRAFDGFIELSDGILNEPSPDQKHA